MKGTIKVDVLDEDNYDTVTELMVDVESDIFNISMKGLKVMSGMWSGNLQKVFQRALEIWKVEKKE